MPFPQNEDAFWNDYRSPWTQGQHMRSTGSGQPLDEQRVDINALPAPTPNPVAWTNVPNLPDQFMKVHCKARRSGRRTYPGRQPVEMKMTNGSMVVYFYDPCDKTFRTKKGRNRTKFITSWKPA